MVRFFFCEVYIYYLPVKCVYKNDQSSKYAAEKSINLKISEKSEENNILQLTL